MAVQNEQGEHSEYRATVGADIQRLREIGAWELADRAEAFLAGYDAGYSQLQDTTDQLNQLIQRYTSAASQGDRTTT